MMSSLEFNTMDNSNKIVPPHLNAEVYRTDTTGTNTVSYLDYICLHSDGSILVGCSELTGRYWNGSASVYSSVSDAQKLHSETKSNISLISGSADGCFIESSTKVLLCDDNGAVSIWTTNEDVWKIWTMETSVAEHDNGVLAVDCLDSGKEYVTVGADGNIKVWDINELICIRNYTSAHSMAIHGVAVRPKSVTCFATASLDEYITLWDDNVAKPVVDLIKNDCGVRCLQWVDQNQLVYGDEAGVLRSVDIRNPGSSVELTDFPAAVHKLAVHPESDMIAVCCDNKIVSVCDLSEVDKAKVIYHDRHMHSNYVRGLAWDVKEKNYLHTVGWSGEIKTHEITKTKTIVLYDTMKCMN